MKQPLPDTGELNELDSISDFSEEKAPVEDTSDIESVDRQDVKVSWILAGFPSLLKHLLKSVAFISLTDFSSEHLFTLELLTGT